MAEATNARRDNLIFTLLAAHTDWRPATATRDMRQPQFAALNVPPTNGTLFVGDAGGVIRLATRDN
jgi:hypothetical protein